MIPKRQIYANHHSLVNFQYHLSDQDAVGLKRPVHEGGAAVSLGTRSGRPGPKRAKGTGDACVYACFVSLNVERERGLGSRLCEICDIVAAIERLGDFKDTPYRW